MAGPKMRFGNVQKKEGNLAKRVPYGAHITYVILGLFLSFHSILAGPIESEFFGADRNKIEEAPKYLKICHKSDKRLDKCIKSSLEKFMKVINSDSEHLNLPNLDPIELPLLEFQLGSGNVSLHMTFKDFRIKGFKNFTVTNVKSNIIDNKFEISVENPCVIMVAQFSARGGLYTFPISGDGDFYVNLTDVSAVFIFRLTTVNLLPGLKFFTVEDGLIDLVSSEINGHFGEFIDGSNVIGAAFNTFFNNNAHEIFTLIKPKLSSTLAGIFGSVANEILSRHPDDVLLPE